jgi:hypothetical protein
MTRITSLITFVYVSEAVFFFLPAAVGSGNSGPSWSETFPSETLPTLSSAFSSRSARTFFLVAAFGFAGAFGLTAGLGAFDATFVVDFARTLVYLGRLGFLKRSRLQSTNLLIDRGIIIGF